MFGQSFINKDDNDAYYYSLTYSPISYVSQHLIDRISPQIHLLLKNASKKSSLTKKKALEDLVTVLQNEEEDTAVMLEIWATFFKPLLFSTSVPIRSLTFSITSLLLRRLRNYTGSDIKHINALLKENLMTPYLVFTLGETSIPKEALDLFDQSFVKEPTTAEKKEAKRLQIIKTYTSAIFEYIKSGLISLSQIQEDEQKIRSLEVLLACLATMARTIKQNKFEKNDIEKLHINDLFTSSYPENIFHLLSASSASSSGRVIHKRVVLVLGAYITFYSDALLSTPSQRQQIKQLIFSDSKENIFKRAIKIMDIIAFQEYLSYILLPLSGLENNPFLFEHDSDSFDPIQSFNKIIIQQSLKQMTAIRNSTSFWNDLHQIVERIPSDLEIDPILQSITTTVVKTLETPGKGERPANHALFTCQIQLALFRLRFINAEADQRDFLQRHLQAPLHAAMNTASTKELNHTLADTYIRICAKLVALIGNEDGKMLEIIFAIMLESLGQEITNLSSEDIEARYGLIFRLISCMMKEGKLQNNTNFEKILDNEVNNFYVDTLKRMMSTMESLSNLSRDAFLQSISFFAMQSISVISESEIENGYISTATERLFVAASSSRNLRALSSVNNLLLLVYDITKREECLSRAFELSLLAAETADYQLLEVVVERIASSHDQYKSIILKQDLKRKLNTALSGLAQKYNEVSSHECTLLMNVFRSSEILRNVVDLKGIFQLILESYTNHDSALSNDEPSHLRELLSALSEIEDDEIGHALEDYAGLILEVLWKLDDEALSVTKVTIVKLFKTHQLASAKITEIFEKRVFETLKDIRSSKESELEAIEIITKLRAFENFMVKKNISSILDNHISVIHHLSRTISRFNYSSMIISNQFKFVPTMISDDHAVAITEDEKELYILELFLVVYFIYVVYDLTLDEVDIDRQLAFIRFAIDWQISVELLTDLQSEREIADYLNELPFSSALGACMENSVVLTREACSGDNVFAKDQRFVSEFTYLRNVHMESQNYTVFALYAGKLMARYLDYGISSEYCSEELLCYLVENNKISSRSIISHLVFAESPITNAHITPITHRITNSSADSILRALDSVEENQEHISQELIMNMAVLNVTLSNVNRTESAFSGRRAVILLQALIKGQRLYLRRMSSDFSLIHYLFCSLISLMIQLTISSPGSFWNETATQLLSVFSGLTSRSTWDETILYGALRLYQVLSLSQAENFSLIQGWDALHKSLRQHLYILFTMDCVTSLGRSHMMCSTLLGKILLREPSYDLNDLQTTCYAQMFLQAPFHAEVSFNVMRRQVKREKDQSVIDLALTLNEGQSPDVLFPLELLSIVINPITGEDLDLLESSNFELEVIRLKVRGYCLAWLLIFEYFKETSSTLTVSIIQYLRQNAVASPLMMTIKHLLNSDNLSNVKYDGVLNGFDIKNSMNSTDDLTKAGIELYYEALAHIAPLLRTWWDSSKSDQTFAGLEKLTEKIVSPLLIRRQVEEIQTKKSDFEDDRMDVTASSSAAEIKARFNIDEQALEFKFLFPPTYPLQSIEIDANKRVGVRENRWRGWLLASRSSLAYNDSIIDALQLLQKNFTLHFKDTECAICYSILSIQDKSLPTKKCFTCKNKFHSGCLFKWFKSSNGSSCPLCRTNFFQA